MGLTRTGEYFKGLGGQSQGLQIVANALILAVDK